jgi:type VI protein secretion system component Hcp
MVLLDISANPNIPGESQSKNPTWNAKIQIDSTTWDISQQATGSTGTGIVTGGATAGHLSFSKTMDKSTPLLFGQLCSGSPISTCFVRVVSSGAADPTFAGLYERETYQLGNVIVSRYSTGAASGSGGLPSESWALSFQSYIETFVDLNPDGTKQAADTHGFDFLKGTPI